MPYSGAVSKAIKENFVIQKTEYYDKNDNLQSKRVIDGYVRIYLKVAPNKVLNAIRRYYILNKSTFTRTGYTRNTYHSTYW